MNWGRVENSLTRVAPGVFIVGGPDLSDPRDCLCYLVVGSQARLLVDCGAGPSAARILEFATEAAGAPPTHLALTHAHIDHAGGAAELKRLADCQVLIHAEDAPVLAQGDALRSAANWYGLKLAPLEADGFLKDGDELDLGDGQIVRVIHTPGHTPGSVAFYCPCGGARVLFGQDIHGPFSPAFGSDLDDWRESMEKLLELKADILAEGHYGVFRPAQEVEAFIRGQLNAH
ncbi:hypothetical protein AAU61_02640 [Desulfocarbo indianensis]|nr:hypothetical protein AAU61_02640 [Desulfocarbo indianensis]